MNNGNGSKASIDRISIVFLNILVFKIVSALLED